MLMRLLKNKEDASPHSTRDDTESIPQTDSPQIYNMTAPSLNLSAKTTLFPR